jgi:hypothetical protein
MCGLSARSRENRLSGRKKQVGVLAMMTGLQQQRPWGVSATTRSAPQVQHGANADASSAYAETLAERVPQAPSARPNYAGSAKAAGGAGR